MNLRTDYYNVKRQDYGKSKLLIIAGIGDEKNFSLVVGSAVNMVKDGRCGNLVYVEVASSEVVKIIQSYTDIVNKMGGKSLKNWS